MGFMRQIPDIARSMRRPAIRPFLKFIQIQNLAQVTVGLTAVQLTTDKIPCRTVIIQADNANLGIICLGGQMVTAASGLQLDAGRAALLSTDQSLNAGAVIASAIGHGLERYAAQGGIPASPGEEEKIEVISLSDLYLVANLAGQLARVLYLSYIS